MVGHTETAGRLVCGFTIGNQGLVTTGRIYSMPKPSLIGLAGRLPSVLTEFDERLWHSMVDFVTVYADNDVRFTFKDGREIQV